MRGQKIVDVYVQYDSAHHLRDNMPLARPLEQVELSRVHSKLGTAYLEEETGKMSFPYIDTVLWRALTSGLQNKPTIEVAVWQRESGKLPELLGVALWSVANLMSASGEIQFASKKATEPAR